MTTTYKERECYKCGVALVVPRHDDSTYFYCQACAFSKIGEPVGLSYAGDDYDR